MKRIEKLEEWKKGNKESPFVMDINPTNRCNLECRSCWQRDPRFDDMDYSDEMSGIKLKEVVEEGIEMGIEKFEITGGGEPMVRSDVVTDIMEKIKQSGRKGNLTTNGTLLGENELDIIIDIRWDQITFSLDGPDAHTNDSLRGEGSFASIIDSLEYLKENKEGGKPGIKFNTVISRKNYDKLEQIIELGNRFNANFISFETLTVHSEEGEKLKLRKEEKKELVQSIDQLQKKADELGIDTNIADLEGKYFNKSNEMDEVMEETDMEGGFSSIPCYEPWYHIVVKVDGSVQPCCLYDSKEENVKDKSLKDIWYGEFFEKIREDMRKGNFSEFCKICNASQVINNKELRRKLGD